jgi:hypothetical protein
LFSRGAIVQRKWLMVNEKAKSHGKYTEKASMPSSNHGSASMRALARMIRPANKLASRRWATSAERSGAAMRLGQCESKPANEVAATLGLSAGSGGGMNLTTQHSSQVFGPLGVP